MKWNKINEATDKTYHSVEMKRDSRLIASLRRDVRSFLPRIREMLETYSEHSEDIGEYLSEHKYNDPFVYNYPDNEGFEIDYKYSDDYALFILNTEGRPSMRFVFDSDTETTKYDYSKFVDITASGRVEWDWDRERDSDRGCRYPDKDAEEQVFKFWTFVKSKFDEFEQLFYDIVDKALE